MADKEVSNKALIEKLRGLISAEDDLSRLLMLIESYKILIETILLTDNNPIG